MDFPERVDCVIDGTGLSESLISASLSILGKQVLHIDRNDYYGGVLASLRFSEFEKFLNQNQTKGSIISPSFDGKILDLSEINSSLVTHRSSYWYLSDTCSKSFDDKEDEVNTCGTVNNTSVSDVPSTTTLPIDKTVQRNHIGDEISDVIRQLGDEYQQEVGHNVSDERENDVIAPNQVSTNVDIKENCQNFSWSRLKLQKAVRRHDIDILPKIVYSHSPTVTALLRADVTRYLEFRFVSRLLAFVSDDNQYETKAGISSNDANNQVNSKRLVGRVVKIPVCRSDVFKTRLLSLHQKRALGSFFEWCFHLIINDTQHDATSVNCDDDYSTYENRPFQDFLTEKRKLDKFTQQLLITNLSFANQLIKTKEAIFRIRRLLFSMGRFGPYPILWPMYGSGDLTQGYCRMSAVFGAIFCLECTVKKIESVSVSEATTTVASESSLSSLSQSVPVINTNDDIIVHLSNGKQVRTKCVVLSPECVPFSWISSHITQWCARAILITDRSLLSDDCKPTDISLLAYSSNKIQDDSYLDPILIIECQIEKPNKSYGDLFIVHLCAIIQQPSDPKKIFQPVLNCLFTQYDTVCCSETMNQDQGKLPKILWAGYFCVPDLSSIPNKLPTPTESSSLVGSNIFITSGPDAGPDLDSIIPNAEEIFRNIISILGLSNVPQNLTSTTETPEDSRDISQPIRSSIYTTTDANWDGQFPPRAPRPEDIIAVDESMESPPIVTIEAPHEDQN